MYGCEKMREMKIGIEESAKAIVDQSNTAKAVGSGSMEVFGTPMMIALMEQATCHCVKDYLENDETTVGTKIDVSHTAPSVVGKNVSALAVLEAIEGRKLTFSVTASDDNGEIGKGKIERFLVFSGKFFEKAKSK